MSAPVDVVGLLEIANVIAITTGHQEDEEWAEKFLEARAAVAELMDKADSYLTLGHSDTAVRELRAALAACGGAK